jgi:hypothetical protein
VFVCLCESGCERVCVCVCCVCVCVCVRERVVLAIPADYDYIFYNCHFLCFRKSFETSWTKNTYTANIRSFIIEAIGETNLGYAKSKIPITLHLQYIKDSPLNETNYPDVNSVFKAFFLSKLTISNCNFCKKDIVKWLECTVVNGNYWFRYRFLPKFRYRYRPTFRYRLISKLSVAADISAWLPAEISVLYIAESLFEFHICT